MGRGGVGVFVGTVAAKFLLFKLKAVIRIVSKKPTDRVHCAKSGGKCTENAKRVRAA